MEVQSSMAATSNLQLPLFDADGAIDLTGIYNPAMETIDRRFPAVEEDVEALQTTVDEIADYIVREGSSGGVHYRIWNSGTRELWGNKQMTFNGNGGGKATVTFPTACRFSNYENYNVFLQLMGTSDSSANDFNNIQVTSTEMATSGFTIYGWNTSANTRYYRVAFHVIGQY